jgi:predicted MFS family arabinose efflux permease
LALATGAAVANLYYAQPLLHTLGGAFHVGTAATGLLVTISQIGYVCGLAFLVPLGDLFERRKLITFALVCIAVGQAVCAVAPDLAVFASAVLFVGVASFIGQVIVPMSALLAAEHERGKVVGTVMSGLLIGVLLSRTLSGVIAELFGWRTVFAFASVLMVLMAALLWRKLPRVDPTSDLPYGAALRSVVQLIRTEPVLRQRMVLGATAMGCFSVLWTSLAFLLSGVHGSHYHYSNLTIGLFGLAGVAGAAAAQITGRAADRGQGATATTVTLLLMTASWVVLAFGADSLAVLILGIVLLDFGVQGTQISNQTAIYQLHPNARSRLTTAYMTAYFTGGAICSALTGALYAADGWSAVCVFGGTVSLVGAVTWALTANRVRTGPTIAA